MFSLGEITHEPCIFQIFWRWLTLFCLINICDWLDLSSGINLICWQSVRWYTSTFFTVNYYLFCFAPLCSPHVNNNLLKGSLSSACIGSIWPSGLHQLQLLEVCHGCMCPWVGARLIALMLYLSQTICILFIWSQLFIPKGLHWSSFICVLSVECCMQTNVPIHLVNFGTFFLLYFECIRRKLFSFSPTHLHRLESCEIRLFLEVCCAVLAVFISFGLPRTPREKTVQWRSFWGSVVGQC